MTGIINIIFPGILEVLCPTGMSCLPRFQTRLESVWALGHLFACISSSSYQVLLDASEGNRTLSTKPHCTTDPQQGKHHEPSWIQQAFACKHLPLYLPVPRSRMSGDCFAYLSLIALSFCPEKSLTGCHIAAGCSLPFHRSSAECCCFELHKAAVQELSSRNFPCPSPIICIPRAGQAGKVMP